MAKSAAQRTAADQSAGADQLADDDTQSLEPWLDASLSWVVDAVLDGEVEASAAFFDLEPQAQLLAVQMLRTALRAALDAARFNRADFISATAEVFRVWLAPEHRPSTTRE